AAAIAALVPIVGELDLAAVVARHTEEDQRIPSLRNVVAAALLQPEQLEETDRGLGVRDSEHRMEKAHQRLVDPSSFTVTGAGSSAIASRAALPIGPAASSAAGGRTAS